MTGMAMYDSHAQVKRLQAAGFAEDQAEAMIQAIQEALQSHVATKEDLQPLLRRDELQQELSHFPTREELHQELSRFPTREELHQELSRFATREELHRELSRFATREDLQAMKTDIYRVVAYQTVALIGAMLTIVLVID